MRVKGGSKSKNRRKRILNKTEGNRERRGNCHVLAKETLDRSMAYNFRDRKAFKRQMRGVWITRLTAAIRERGFSYNSVIHAMKLKNVGMNRKMLADLAATDPRNFDYVLEALGFKLSSQAA